MFKWFPREIGWGVIEDVGVQSNDIGNAAWVRVHLRRHPYRQCVSEVNVWLIVLFKWLPREIGWGVIEDVGVQSNNIGNAVWVRVRTVLVFYLRRLGNSVLSAKSRTHLMALPIPSRSEV
jgi:hypothetical protein